MGTMASERVKRGSSWAKAGAARRSSAKRGRGMGYRGDVGRPATRRAFPGCAEVPRVRRGGDPGLRNATPSGSETGGEPRRGSIPQPRVAQRTLGRGGPGATPPPSPLRRLLLGHRLVLVVLGLDQDDRLGQFGQPDVRLGLLVQALLKQVGRLLVAEQP